MTQIPTGSDILVALMKDLRFTSMPDENKKVLVPFILAAPEALSLDLLKTKVTPLSLLQAKIAFLKYCLENGLAEKSADLMVASYEKAKSSINWKLLEKRLPELPAADKLVEQIKKALNVLIEFYNKTIKDLPTLLREKGEVEVYVLITFGLSEKVARQCLVENLTIADLLLLEPAAILINSKSKK